MFPKYFEHTKARIFAETDKQWVERGGHLGCYILGVNHDPQTENWRLSRSSMSPEQEFWMEFFMLLLQDALGLTAQAQHDCLDCHGDLRKKDTPKIHHTIQECAKNFIESSYLCEEYCDLINIDIHSLRKELKNGKFRGVIPMRARSEVQDKIKPPYRYAQEKKV